MDNEKKATLIGKIVLGLSIFALLAFIALAVSVMLFFRSCTKVEPNSGKEPYTTDYIENWLEDCYGTDFTFVRELETPKYSDNTAYVYTDGNGLEANVVQHYEHGYMFNGHYEVEDNYAVVKMFADEKVLAALDSAGYEYSFDRGDTAERGVYICVMNAPTYEDIAKAAEILYNAADNHFLEQPDSEKTYGVEFDKFLHRCPCFAVGSPDGYPLSYLNVPLTPKGQIPYQQESLQDFTSECERQYVIWTEKGDITGTVPDSAYDDLKRYSYQVCYDGKPTEHISLHMSDYTGEYIATQYNCFSVEDGKMQLCPMMEELAEIAGMTTADTSGEEGELSFYRSGDTKDKPYMRLYCETDDTGYTRMFLDKEGEQYTFSNGGRVMSDYKANLSVADIYDLFGIRVEFDNKNSVAELFSADDATDTEE